MSSVTLHLVFQGLIAFSPIYDVNQMSNQMTALLVDSRLAPSNSECLVDHDAMIEFPAAESSECIAAPGCKATGSLCRCTLDRQEIELVAESNPPPIPLSQGGPSEPLPEDNTPASAGDFSYVAHLPKSTFNLDPQFLPSNSNPPTVLAARFTFPFESILACDHAVRPDNQNDNVHSFQFHKIGQRAKVTDHEQAIAQMLVASLTVETANLVPKIRLRQFGGTINHDIRLDVSDPALDLVIRIMNHRPNLPYGDPCDDGIGRDFAMFYELLDKPVAWSQRMLPHVKFTSAKPQRDVEPVQCLAFKTPMSRPVCPFVAF